VTGEYELVTALHVTLTSAPSTEADTVEGGFGDPHTRGVTETTELGALSPYLFDAVTRNWCATFGASPKMRMLRRGATTSPAELHVTPASVESHTEYPVIADPPFCDGVDHDKKAVVLFAKPYMFRGLEGAE
jgi:hypothetical protein